MSGPVWLLLAGVALCALSIALHAGAAGHRAHRSLSRRSSGGLAVAHYASAKRCPWCGQAHWSYRGCL